MKTIKCFVIFILLQGLITLTACSSANIEEKPVSNQPDSSQLIKTDTSKTTALEEIDYKDDKVSKIITIGKHTINLDMTFDDSILEIMTDEELKILRNGIYAKYGYSFKSEKYSSLFSQYDWYEPKHSTVTEYMSEQDKEKIAKILLIEQQMKTVEEVHTDELIVGVWHANSCVGAGYSDKFHFYEDYTFQYDTNQYDSERRLISLYGTWKLEGNLLNLFIYKKKIRVGGDFVKEQMPYTDNEYILVNYEVEMQELENEINVLFPLGIPEYKDHYPPYMTIGNMDFWKLSIDPYTYRD